MVQRVDVSGKQGYPLFLGAELGELGSHLQNTYGQDGHYLLISNTTVAKHYAEKLSQGCHGLKLDQIIVPDGEEEKSLERISTLTEHALDLSADRDTIVLALGGGVIGDLAGFFASIFMRGIRYIHIPTTLLSQIDSSIGGKVAVNHPSGKNILGSFHMPQAVWTDFTTLQTLPWKEMRNGLAETIKHTLVAEPDLFEFIDDHADDIKGRNDKILKEMALRSLAVKVKIVSEDEREKGIRMLLNLGHSFGHALETEEDYKGITHGEGVSIGVAAAVFLAKGRDLMTGKQMERTLDLLRRLDLPTTVTGHDPHVLLQHMAADKKNKAGHKILILPVGIGKSTIVKDCSDEEILRAWESVIR
ncbi:3-dehydroquinate synthase [Dehalobacter sp. DCM]|uniref:3-dehydroquinate synthase n=1 Tax=Dehalobacter sp. DCM TaxID=2907827 RepID=UPI003081E8C5|nr:3-dehydroquinate synthase [Dehalobacter sp. DCM]